MFRVDVALLILILPLCGLAQGPRSLPPEGKRRRLMSLHGANCLSLRARFGVRPRVVAVIVRLRHAAECNANYYGRSERSTSIRDPDGIGKVPRLSFLSHDHYINSTNWGVSVGPVLRF